MFVRLREALLLRSSKFHTLLWNFVFFSLFACSAATAQTKLPAMASVKGAQVHIRAGQSNNYESLLQVNAGQELVVTGKNYSWYKVFLPDGAQMFIRMDYAGALAPDIGVVTGDRVNIRARPNTDATIIGKFVRGDKFFVKETRDGWLRIAPVAQAAGWVHEQFIEFKNKQVPAQIFADPQEAAARAAAAKEAANRRRAAKFAVLRAVADGQYEAEGILAQGKAGRYQLMGIDQAKSVVACVDAPLSMAGDFLGDKVIVRGAASDDPSCDAALLTAGKIGLSL
jgi:SH3-like domain-containing protein